MDLGPTDPAEAVAIYRATVIGPLMHPRAHPRPARRRAARPERAALPTAGRGEHAQLLGPDARALVLRLPQGRPRRVSGRSRAAIRPRPGPHGGAAELLLDIRREHRRLGAADPHDARRRGPARRGQVSEPTVRRLYARRGCVAGPRAPRASRRRACAGRPSAPARCGTATSATDRLHADGKMKPVRIHALLDDASRYVVALEAHTTEREDDMLGSSSTPCAARPARRAVPRQRLHLPRRGPGDRVRAARHHAAPRQALRPAGARQDGALLAHAARGVPRLPRRRGLAPGHQRRLRAFLDKHYHARRTRACSARARAGVRRRPAGEGDLDEKTLRVALTERPGAASRATTTSGRRRRLGARPGLPRRPDRHRRRCSSRPASRRGSSTRASAWSSTPSTRCTTRGASGRRAAALPPKSPRARWPSIPPGRCRRSKGRGKTRAGREVPRDRALPPLLRPSERLHQGDPRQRPLAAALQEAVVDELFEAVDEHAQVLLVGEPGVGKTCVLRALRHRLPQAGYRLTYCHNATLGRRDFYRQLCLALGLTPSATAAAVFYAVSAHVEELGRERIHPVFLLDEAHLLHQDTLDHLHILLNYEWDSRALLSLVLVGLPELHDRLALRKNRSLYSRIHRRLSSGPCPDDTAEYLRLRLRRAGCDREVFTSDAVALLHEAAGATCATSTASPPPRSARPPPQEEARRARRRRTRHRRPDAHRRLTISSHHPLGRRLAITMPAPTSPGAMAIPPQRWRSPRDGHRDFWLRPRVSMMAIGQPGHDAISQLERQHRVADRPARVADRPARVADRPARVADRPARVADRPARVADRPARVADRPARVADRPARVADRPARVADRPARVADRPARVADRPARVADRPARVADRPARMADRPARVADRPARVADRPARVADRPARVAGRSTPCSATPRSSRTSSGSSPSTRGATRSSSWSPATSSTSICRGARR